METLGKFSSPQSPWRWDDQTNALVHDRKVAVEKSDLTAETASEKIDLWNLPAGKRPPAYEKYPLEVPKDKKFVAIEDIIHVALNMISDTYFVPDRFADFVKRPELEDFFLYLINYFYWYFEHLDAQVQSNPLCVELNHEERDRITTAKAHMGTALVFVAQKYSNIVLGTGLKQYHHFYWIEGDDSDHMSKKREIIPYSGRVSRTLIDRGYAELLMIFATFAVWITFDRQKFEVIRTEIGRIIRTSAFPNPVYSTNNASTRSARKKTHDASTNENEDEAPNGTSDRKRTGATDKSARSQRTIATSSTEPINDPNSRHGPKRQPIQRLLTQRSPVLMTLLPTAREKSAWLFSRRHGNDNPSSTNVKSTPASEYQIRHEIGVLGRPIEALTMAASGETPAAPTPQMSHIDDTHDDGDINEEAQNED